MEINDELKNNKEVALKRLKESNKEIIFAGENENETEFLNALEENLSLLFSLSDKLKNDKYFMIELIMECYWALLYLGKNLKKDQTIQNLINDEMLSRAKSFMLNMIRRRNSIFQYVSDELKNDEEFMLQVVEQEKDSIELLLKRNSSLAYASYELRNDKNFMLEVIKKNSFYLRYASEELKNDKEFIIKAIDNGIYELEYISDELKNDKDVMLKAIQKRRKLLKYVGNELIRDKDFLAEISQIDNNIIANEMILEVRNFFIEEFINREEGLFYFLNFCGIRIIEKNKFNIEIVGKFTKKTLEQLNLKVKSTRIGTKIFGVIKYSDVSAKSIEYVFDILEANNEVYYIKSWTLHIGSTLKKNLVTFDNLMRNKKQEYCIYHLIDNKKKSIIRYTKKEIEKELSGKPLAIYMNENIKKEENVVIQINNLKPSIMLYLSNIIKLLNDKNNIEHIDYITILKERALFYDVWEFLIRNKIKYIFKWEIEIDEIPENILNQIEDFLKNFNVRYSITKRFENIILDVYPRNEEEISFITDVLKLNNIVYVESYYPDDIELSNTSLWMFSTSRDEKEKICEMLKRPDRKRIDKMKELGVPESIIEVEEAGPTKCTYGLITTNQLQNQIENILQSLKLEYKVLDSERKIIKNYKNPDAINLV